MSKILSGANTLRKALSRGNGLYLRRLADAPGLAPLKNYCTLQTTKCTNLSTQLCPAEFRRFSPILRIPANEGWMVKGALDAGAHGIIVPLLYTVEDAKNPFSKGAFDLKGNLSGYEYMTNANENLLTIVQTETKEALENVGAIAKVDGIDVLFIGPWDLGNNLGYPVTGEFAPELKASIARILKAAHDADKKAGIYCPSGEFARRLATLSDLRCGRHDGSPTFMTNALSQAKGSWKDSVAQAVKGAAYGMVSQQTTE